MRFRGILILGIAAALAGCTLIDRLAERCGKATFPPTFSQYHLAGWSWEGVSRVVALPFLTESEYHRSGDEVRAAFNSEFQRLGRFEVVTTLPDDRATLAAQIHRTGLFDEAEMLDLVKLTRADVVIHGTITQYSPYPRPRMGLILQAVSPVQAKVVASVDGLWDTTDKHVSDRLRAFYRQRPHDRLPYIRRNFIAEDDVFAGELALSSPALFQRFVCHEASLTLLGLPVPGITCDDPMPQPSIGTPPPPSQAGTQPTGPQVPPCNVPPSTGTGQKP